MVPLYAKFGFVKLPVLAVCKAFAFAGCFTEVALVVGAEQAVREKRLATVAMPIKNGFELIFFNLLSPLNLTSSVPEHERCALQISSSFRIA